MNSQDFQIGQTVYKIKKENDLILVIEAKNCVLIDYNYVHIISDNYSYTSYIGHITDCYSTREECINNYKNYILESIKSHENSVKKYKKLLKSDLFKKSKFTIDEIIKNYLIKLGDEIGIHLELLTIYTDSIFIRIRNNSNNFISIDYDNITSINEDEYECLFDIIKMKIKNNLNYLK